MAWKSVTDLGQGLRCGRLVWLYDIVAMAPFWLTATLLLAGALIGLAAGRRLPATAG